MTRKERVRAEKAWKAHEAEMTAGMSAGERCIRKGCAPVSAKTLKAEQGRHGKNQRRGMACYSYDEYAGWKM